jgi:thioredoxin-like negative regulator of GroEL
MNSHNETPDAALHKMHQLLSTLRANVVDAAAQYLMDPDNVMARRELAAMVIAAKRQKAEFDTLAAQVMRPGPEVEHAWESVDLAGL